MGPFHVAKVWTVGGFVDQCMQELMKMRVVTMRMEVDGDSGICGFCAGGDFQS